MNSRLLLRKAFAIGVLALVPALSHAAGFEVHNTSEYIGGTWSSGNGDVIVGPNAQITVNGDWYITGSRMYINPAATITGTGTIHLMTPVTFGAPAAATFLDGGGVSIGCKLSVENGNTVSLGLIDPVATYGAGIGFTDPGVAAGSNDLVLANNLNFGSPSAHVVINTSNLKLGAASNITYVDLNTAGFTPDPTPPANAYQAYIVTNGATSGVVTKQGVAAAGSFTFPVGQSGPLATPYDYTPATITNTSGATRSYSIRVQSYANSAATEGNVTTGMDRTWQITADAAGTATIALTHNDVTGTNIGTDNTAFNPAKAYITQQTATGVWSINATTSNGGTPVNTLSASFTIPVSGATSYFSKTSDTLNSLNPFIAVNPYVFLQGAFSGGTMTNTLRTANLIPTTQPYNFAPFNYAGTETSTAMPSNTTDWVLVELRDATTPSTVIATRAALVLQNSHVVDVDGASAIYFRSVAPGNYFIAIRHRNHLGIRSATAQTFVQDIPTSYDFTTAQTQAYQDPAIMSNPAMVSLSGGVFGLYGGNANSNTTTRFSGPTNDPNYILNTTLGGNNLGILTNVYDNSDVNMNGVVRYSGPGNDPNFILNTVLLGNNLLILTQHL